MAFCPKCGTLCINDIKEQDILKFNSGMTVTVKSDNIDNSDVEFYKKHKTIIYCADESQRQHGDNPYVQILLKYSKAGFLNTNLL